MTAQDRTLEAILSEVQRLHRRLDAVQMQREPEWMTVKQYAEKIGRSTRTVARLIDAGKVEARREGNVRMVRFNPDA